MATTMKPPVEGTDFWTYQPGNRQSGWNWYCLSDGCPGGDASRGWRFNRTDARKDARAHVATPHEQESE